MTKMTRYVFMFILLSLFTLMAACGGKSEEGVVKKIEGTLNDMTGYKVKAEMMMNTGQEQRNYHIDIWYKKGENDFYRVGLENESDEGGQVILKNSEGVFVLTPALKKSFKFQTDWPENNSQPYLYQSLVNDVLSDKDATFTSTDSHYVFLTKTNYQNSTNLPFQEVYFDKKTYTPTGVKVMDKDHNALVEVKFSNVDQNPSFTKNDFDREAILEDTLAEMSVTNMEMSEELAVMYPLKTAGAELVEKEEVSLEDGERVIMTFKGDRNFTLIQEKQSVVPTSGEMTREVIGDMVNLGDYIGAITNNTIEWNQHGTDFYLASEDMTMEEMIEVASSISGQEIK